MDRVRMRLRVKTRQIRVSDVAKKSEFWVPDGGQLDPMNLSWTLMIDCNQHLEVRH